MATEKNDKQRSTKHTQKTKNQVTRTPLTHSFIRDFDIYKLYTSGDGFF